MIRITLRGITVWTNMLHGKSKMYDVCRFALTQNHFTFNVSVQRRKMDH